MNQKCHSERTNIYDKIFSRALRAIVCLLYAHVRGARVTVCDLLRCVHIECHFHCSGWCAHVGWTLTCATQRIVCWIADRTRYPQTSSTFEFGRLKQESIATEMFGNDLFKPRFMSIGDREKNHHKSTWSFNGEHFSDFFLLAISYYYLWIWRNAR